MGKNSRVTTERIYSNVIEKERRGDYLGKTVQIIPHITNEIKDHIYSFENEDIDNVITEIGGTVGDIERFPFVEAIRQVGGEKNPEEVLYTCNIITIYKRFKWTKIKTNTILCKRITKFRNKTTNISM